MLAERVLADAWEVDPRLAELANATRQEFIEVVRGVVAARADAVENDPVTAEGHFAYIYGTRCLRALMRTKGWLLHRRDNIEAVCHPERLLRFVYQNVDVACSRSQRPRPVSAKGSGSERAIDDAQGSLFSEEELRGRELVKPAKLNSGVWYFCVSVDGDDVRAELSLPSAISGGSFEAFIERIFIVREGEWGGLKLSIDNDLAEFEPTVTRRTE